MFDAEINDKRQLSLADIIIENDDVVQTTFNNSLSKTSNKNQRKQKEEEKHKKHKKKKKNKMLKILMPLKKEMKKKN